ncbi:hypothetical protein ACMXYO_05850 [Neptuniibacter sp. QD37_6]|uniref:hypothetical protein n=1 Tax=Neptuniibacter sp. QD37_6 TaxID=3398210 RepID=UPI0039F4E7E8
MDQLDSVCPIFRDKTDERFCQEGSGVLIEFRGHTFLLTAAHVMDQLESADLLIPCKNDEIRSIEGSYAYIKSSGDRENDKYDFGYFKLDKEFASNINKQFYVVKEHEFGIELVYAEKELFSFVGYPHRKSNVSGELATTESYAYGTYHADLSEYAQLGYKLEDHIVTKYNRKNSFNPKAGRVELSVLPHGISGGGVFIWPVDTHIPPRNRKLVAIGHSWKTDGYFVATRLEVFLEAILRNNPTLRKTKATKSIEQ